MFIFKFICFKGISINATRIWDRDISCALHKAGVIRVEHSEIPKLLDPEPIVFRPGEPLRGSAPGGWSPLGAAHPRPQYSIPELSMVALLDFSEMPKLLDVEPLLL